MSAHKADMATLRMALRKMHRRACGDESAVYMSIPADRERDADLVGRGRGLRGVEGWRRRAVVGQLVESVFEQHAGPEVWPALLAEVAMSPELRALCEERDALGRAKYGTPLRVHNGREPLVDALQEALDLAVYLQQAMMRARGERLMYLARMMRDDALNVARALLDEVTP